MTPSLAFETQMNLGLGKPCKCLLCKQDMYRKRLYDHMRSKHKEYYESKKEEHGTFKPQEGTEFTFEDVDLEKMKEESEVTVQPRSKAVRKSSRALSSQTSGESDVSDYKGKRSRKTLHKASRKRAENPEEPIVAKR